MIESEKVLAEFYAYGLENRKEEYPLDEMYINKRQLDAPYSFLDKQIERLLIPSMLKKFLKNWDFFQDFNQSRIELWIGGEKIKAIKVKEFLQNHPKIAKKLATDIFI